MSWKNLLLTSYWFTSPVIVSAVAFWWLVVVLVCLVAVGIGLITVSQKQKEESTRLIMQRWGSWGFSTGLVGALLLALRQQSAFLLSWRVWYLVVAVGIVPWLARLLYYTFKRWPEIRAENAARNLRAKYLPGNR